MFEFLEGQLGVFGLFGLLVGVVEKIGELVVLFFDGGFFFYVLRGGQGVARVVVEVLEVGQ